MNKLLIEPVRKNCDLCLVYNWMHFSGKEGLQ